MICVEETQNEWAPDLVARVGRQVKQLRSQERPPVPRMTAQQLANAVTERGAPMSRATVSDLENGRRGAHLTVPELVAIADALGVSPVSLLAPELPDGAINVMGDDVRSLDFLRWVSGEAGPPREVASLPPVTPALYRTGAQLRVGDGNSAADKLLILSRAFVAGIRQLHELPSPEVIGADAYAELVKRRRDEMLELRAQISVLGGELVSGGDSGTRSAGD